MDPLYIAVFMKLARRLAGEYISFQNSLLSPLDEVYSQIASNRWANVGKWMELLATRQCWRADICPTLDKH